LSCDGQSMSRSWNADTKCLACVKLVEKLIETVEISSIELNGKSIATGSFRVDPDGKQRGIKYIPYARSELHLVGILESICSEFSKEIRFIQTNSGKSQFLSIEQFESYQKENEQMYSNDDSDQESDDEQSSSVDKNIKYHNKKADKRVLSFCESFVDSYESELLSVLRKPFDNLNPNEICSLNIQLCSENQQPNLEL